MTDGYVMRRFVYKILIGAVSLAPICAVADDTKVSAYLLATQPAETNQQTPNSLYKSVSENLEAYLLTQNIFVISGNQMNSGVPRFDKQTIKQMIKRSALEETDFGISYEITPILSETSFSRNLKVSAAGAIYNPVSGEVITTSTVTATHTKTLSKNKTECGSACVNNALSEMSYDLSREMSFVLGQKLHFIQEDRAVTDTTSSDAIKNRLNTSTKRKAAPRTIKSNLGEFEVDVARSINIEVYFEFDSDKLTAKAKTQLKPLGEALSGMDLTNASYLIIGHTDAKGSSEYNQKLSERRAISVRTHLIEGYPIRPTALRAIGLGETQLKKPSEPNAAMNRRVEISALITEKAAVKSTNDGTLKDYTLDFELFENKDVLKLVRALEANHVREIELIKSSTTSRIYSVSTDLSAIELEEKLMNSMLDLNIDIDRVRIAISRDQFVIEKL